MDAHTYLMEALVKERLAAADAEIATRALLASGDVHRRRRLSEWVAGGRGLLQGLRRAIIATPTPVTGSKAQTCAAEAPPRPIGG
jgi:hypothetical protein